MMTESKYIRVPPCLAVGTLAAIRTWDDLKWEFFATQPCAWHELATIRSSSARNVVLSQTRKLDKALCHRSQVP
jgi:hypothetical protein